VLQDGCDMDFLWRSGEHVIEIGGWGFNGASVVGPPRYYELSKDHEWSTHRIIGRQSC